MMNLDMKKKVTKFLDNLSIERRTIGFNNKVIINAEIFLPAMFKDEVIGIAGVYRKFGVPNFFVVVKHQHQHKGICRKLMERLYEIYLKKKYNFVVLTVYDFNHRAIQIYKKQGYVYAGKRKGTIYMILPLTQVGNFVTLFSRILLKIIGD